MKNKLVGIAISLFINVSGLFGQLGVQMFRNPDRSIKDIFFKEEGGIDVLQLRYFGSNSAVGYFANSTECFGISGGILLSTGMAYTVGTPNRSGNTGVSLGTQGDRDLSRIARGPTFDASIIVIDFIPNSDSIAFDYFFGSEEYPEFVNKGVNDVFAFLIRKKGTQLWKNIAVLPNGIPVTVDHINQQRNPEYFVSNTRLSPHFSQTSTADKNSIDLAQNFMFDGFTKRMKAGTKVEPGVQYEMKIALSDVGDDLYDSGVFLAANSFEAVNYLPNMEKVVEKAISLIVEKNPNIQMRKINDTVVVELYFAFDFNSFSIADADKPIIQQLAQIAVQQNNRVEVFGHTDSVGTNSYNLELSQNRAQSVANIFITSGFDPSLILIKGFGATKPLFSNSNDEGRSKNRRVELLFLK